MPSLDDFATWAGLARLLTVGNQQTLLADGGFVAGSVAGRTSSFTGRVGNGSAAHHQAQAEAVGLISAALAEAGRGHVAFALRVTPAGQATLDLFDHGPAVERLPSAYPESMILVEGAVPEPWRREPEPTPHATPAPTADPARLERLLRERLPGDTGATGEELAATEARLGVPLPAELATLYRATRGGADDDEHAGAIGCYLLPLDELTVADARWRRPSWRYGAAEAVRTPPHAVVQGLPGSPGWIVFASDGGSARFAVDLTPGPAGHLGQIIVLDGPAIGADLVADSLTDMVEHGSHHWRPGRAAEFPAVARINDAGFATVEAAAHPELEVLTVGRRDGDPVRLAAVAGLPRLRTVQVQPGLLADPLEVTGLPALEYVELGTREWRTLLTRGAVPDSLLAAGIAVEPGEPPEDVAALANEVLALRDRPRITRTTIRGDLLST
ncbi:SMI1/KNR4 family protein [Paractinoplanes abujensis]|uniref:Cell wall assembly regulator SMI1 n=1 Tax=Paractinoplanes abujensis TaxID=882441 RepID=A0A7W7CNW0_9ACTN|nr:SMI1/KNR4 family protein [Actinoplanes abujensis]MBB4691981.1 cell wall assembly regulator SMI1 [Actinoplanes abujensis]GID16601.1 SMI1/KNR4 family protein [Actinoplanes abujensis]